MCIIVFFFRVRVLLPPHPSHLSAARRPAATTQAQGLMFRKFDFGF